MMAESGSITPSRDEDGTRIHDNSRAAFSYGDFYEIKIEGHLDVNWSEWLGGMEISHDEDGYTLLRGVIPDQAALHGVLGQIRDLSLVLVSLKPAGIEKSRS